MKRQLTLCQFIWLLERCEQEAEVRFDFCSCVPVNFDSYRGVYSDLALSWQSEYQKVYQKVTVSELIKGAVECLGKRFTGYKGGEYVMSGETTLWVANRGEAGRTAIVGIIEQGYMAVIETAYQP
jgi:hypothetical protein